MFFTKIGPSYSTSVCVNAGAYATLVDGKPRTGG